MKKVVEIFNVCKDFCVNVFHQCKAYCIEHPLFAGITAGALVFFIILLIIIGALTKKAKDAEKQLAAQAAAEETAAQAATETTVEVPAEETKAEESVVETVTNEPVEESVETPVEESVETPVEEPVEEPVETPVEEPVETPVEEPTPVPTEVKAEETVETPVEETAMTSETQSANELADALDKAEQKDDLYEEDETDKHARYAGKWVICKVISDALAENEEMYFFELHASNGEKLLMSEEYTSYNGALRGIQTHKTNILKGNFKITLSKKGDYIFKLLSGKNMLLCMGENYATRARCESAIESTMRFAKTAIVDENVQDFIIKTPKEDDEPIAPLPDNCNGKWVIDTINGPDGEKLFYFELFANNGEKLLSSEEYTTYIGAVNGIETHKKNIDNNNFRITLTKHGDYIFKLLNGNGQLLCLGEHYKTKRLCQNAVDSVKRFAPNSPTLIDSALTKPQV